MKGSHSAAPHHNVQHENGLKTLHFHARCRVLVMENNYMWKISFASPALFDNWMSLWGLLSVGSFLPTYPKKKHMEMRTLTKKKNAPLEYIMWYTGQQWVMIPNLPLTKQHWVLGLFHVVSCIVCRSVAKAMRCTSGNISNITFSASCFYSPVTSFTNSLSGESSCFWCVTKHRDFWGIANDIQMFGLFLLKLNVVRASIVLHFNEYERAQSYKDEKIKNNKQKPNTFPNIYLFRIISKSAKITYLNLHSVTEWDSSSHGQSLGETAVHMIVMWKMSHLPILVCQLSIRWWVPRGAALAKLHQAEAGLSDQHPTLIYKTCYTMPHAGRVSLCWSDNKCQSFTLYLSLWHSLAGTRGCTMVVPIAMA